ncbi:MAG: hypothetical protein WAP03_30705 [Methylorubrum rhodinum]|uniref:hypothetical protein n=1 Tax=Methylorubrum rhodinum TaxID=29428 RepID=UPI003BAFCE05
MFHLTEAFWLYYSLLPSFFAIIAADRLGLIIYQQRYGRRVFLSLVGGVIGGTTSTTMLAYFLSANGLPSFSFDTIFDYFVVSLSGVPAGMLLGMLMAAPKVGPVRSGQCTGR